MVKVRDRMLFLLALIGLLSASQAGAAVPDPYAVSFWPVTYKDLPLPGGGPLIWIYPEGTTWAYANSQDAQLPFPVRFFDEWYTEASAASSGYLSFGSVATAGVPGMPNYGGERDNFSIPPTFYEEARSPSRLIALWWDDIRCGPGGTIRSQVLGTKPNRQYVIEWKRCVRYNPAGPSIGTLNMQLWLTEGSDTLEVRYGKIEEGPPAYPFAASVGVMSPLDQDTILGYPGLDCTPDCGVEHWEEGRMIVYSQEPDLSLDALRVDPVGYANLPAHVEVDVSNLGIRTASPVPIRLWLSPSQVLDERAILLQDTASTPALAEGDRWVAEANPRLPMEIDLGNHWIVAEVNPDRSVPESSRMNNLLRQRIEVLPGTPDLSVGVVSTPAVAQAGELVSLQWEALNLGGAAASSVLYSLRLSSSGVVSVTDPELGTGRINLNRFSSRLVQELVQLPDDLVPGSYWIGVILDPDQELAELDERNNDGVGNRISIGDPQALLILTNVLPPGEIGAPYCKVLEARGGDGAYRWTLAPGSLLPPGLSLETYPAGAEAAGQPFITRLCGRPSRLGTFSFDVEVRSDGVSANQTLQIEVGATGQPLTIATADLPVATFASPYLAHLGAVGGTTPYAWVLGAGGLPKGLALRSSGEIVGLPAESGTFNLEVRVEDAAGTIRSAQLRLVVAGPARLACPGIEALHMEPDQPFAFQLEAMGGVAPYRWSTRSTTRLSLAIGEQNLLLGDQPVPGLTLESDGTVGGAATEVGSYRWTVEVRDAREVSEFCAIRVEVGANRSLTVITNSLPAAVAGASYAARLDAAGGRGALRWKLHEGSRLPAGLGLDEEGRLTGNLSLSALQGEASREASFVVEVRDRENRRGVGAVSILLQAEEPAGTDPTGSGSASGGCQAGGTAGPGGAGIWLAIALLLVGRHGPLPWRWRSSLLSS